MQPLGSSINIHTHSIQACLQSVHLFILIKIIQEGIIIMEINMNHAYKIGIQIVVLILLFLQVQFAHAQPVFNGHMSESLFDDYRTCDDDEFPESRIYMEAQSWWIPTPNYPYPDNPYTGKQINDFGHVHVGTCFPFKQTITPDNLENGKLMEFEVLLTFHSYPAGSKFRYLRPHIFNNESVNNQWISRSGKRAISPTVWFDDYDGPNGLVLNDRDPHNRYISGGFNGPDIDDFCNEHGRVQTHTHNDPETPRKTCTIALNFKLDMTEANLDGFHEFRFLTALKEPDGFEMHTSTSWIANLDLGNTVDNDYNNFIEARGWYSGSNYIASRVYGDSNFGSSSINNTGLPTKAQPLDPLSATHKSWSPEVTARDGASFGARISQGEVYLNPSFHDGIDNEILLYSREGDPVTNSAFKRQFLTIDATTPGIKNGWNRLVVITHADCEVDGIDNPGPYSRENDDDDCQCNDLIAVSNCSTDQDQLIPFGEFAGQRSSGVLVVPFYAQNIPTDDIVDACGDPGYDRVTERELFIWQDCSGDGTWYVRATTGGVPPTLTYEGTLSSDQSFSNVIEYKVEPRDTVDSSNSQSIYFHLTIGGVWDDGFNFQVPEGNTCLTLNTPTGITVKVGENRIPISSPFDIHTLESCQS